MPIDSKSNKIGEILKTPNGSEVILSIQDFEDLIKYIRYLEDKVEKLNTEIENYNNWVSEQINQTKKG